MKLKSYLASLAIACLLISEYAGAATLLEETALVSGTSSDVYSFTANQTPLLYEVALVDLEFSDPFDSLAVGIATTTDSVLFLSAPGTATFSPVLGITYFATVVGVAGGVSGIGTYGLSISTVPLPPALLLLGSNVLGLIAFRRRVADRKIAQSRSRNFPWQKPWFVVSHCQAPDA